MKRDWMIENREKLGLTRVEMARRIRKPGYWQCSEKLLTLLETDAANVTHPGIAKLIAKEYHATREQAEKLLPRHRRKHDPEYDPDRYKLEADWEHGAMPGGLSGRMIL